MPKKRRPSRRRAQSGPAANRRPSRSGSSTRSSTSSPSASPSPPPSPKRAWTSSTSSATAASATSGRRWRGAGALPGPAPSGLRAVAERRSAGPLAALTRLPRAVPAVLAGALLLVGLVVRSWLGTLCLAGVLLFVAWLTYLSWPRLDGRGRALRLLMIVLLVVVTGTALLPR